MHICWEEIYVAFPIKLKSVFLLIFHHWTHLSSCYAFKNCWSIHLYYLMLQNFILLIELIVFFLFWFDFQLIFGNMLNFFYAHIVRTYGKFVMKYFSFTWRLQWVFATTDKTTNTMNDIIAFWQYTVRGIVIPNNELGKYLLDSNHVYINTHIYAINGIFK